MRHRYRLVLPLLAIASSADAVHAQAAATTAPPPATRLTEPQDDYPSHSPDGTRIVFQSNRSGTWQLWLMNRDGSGLRRLTQNTANDRTPDWSRDGRSIVFSSDRLHPDGAAGLRRQNIFVLDVASGTDEGEPNARLLVVHDGQDIHPKWTNDGSMVVFNRLAPPGGTASADVMLADRDGRDVRRIPLPSGLNTYASITPDGRRLVYRGTSRESLDGREVENSDIFTAARDGSDRRRLTSDAAFDGWPAISPDGRTIAFSSRRHGDRFHVYLMSIDGGLPHQITAGAYHHTQPAWSPDGRSLVVYRWTRDEVAEIGHLVRLDLPRS